MEFVTWANAIYFLVVIQIFLALRYVVKASFGQVNHYSFLNLILVLLIPIAGYFIVMKKENAFEEEEEVLIESL